jgi:hypothetical protein
MKQFVIDANKVVLSVSNPDTRVDDAEFEENEVYAIYTFLRILQFLNSSVMKFVSFAA